MEAYLFGAGASAATRARSPAFRPLGPGPLQVFDDLAIAGDRIVRIGHLVNYVRDTRGIGVLDFIDWNEDIESFLSEVTKEVTRAVRKRDRTKSLVLNMVYDQTAFLFNTILNEIHVGWLATPYRRMFPLVFRS